MTHSLSITSNFILRNAVIVYLVLIRFFFIEESSNSLKDFFKSISKLVFVQNTNTTKILILILPLIINISDTKILVA